MAYETVSVPAGIAGYGSPGFLGTLGEVRSPVKAPAACPPIRFTCDADCPFPPFLCAVRKKELCDRILGAINLANKAAARLEAKPLSAATLSLFQLVFGQPPSEPWELPGQPSKTMQAGALVAKRFRRIANELQIRDTIYRCVAANRCLIKRSGIICLLDPQAGTKSPIGPGTAEKPCHATESMVVDAVAMALLCKNEVWLCPPFWQLKKEWQEGTILHEMLHLCFGLTCAWFQHDQKEKKRNSANCYEVFAVSGVTIPDPASAAACKATPK